MSKTGHSTNSLSDRLAVKLEQDRKQIEEMTLSEHKKLAENFLSASKAEFDTIRSAIQGESQTTAQTLGAMLRWPLWTVGLCVAMILISLIMLWGMTWWTKTDLDEIRRATALERQALSDLKSQTAGVRIIQSKNETFIVLPKEAKGGWSCTDEKLPCYKIQLAEKD